MNKSLTKTATPAKKSSAKSAKKPVKKPAAKKPAAKKPARRRSSPAVAVASDTPFDSTAYQRMPRMDVAGAIGLTVQLIATRPTNPPAPVKRALASAKKSYRVVDKLWVARNRASKAPDPRPIDSRADSAWATFFDRLENYTRLPADKYPLSARAGELMTLLFPERVAFIRFDYPSQWAEMNKIFGLIESDDLTADLEKVVGADFLTEVTEAQVAYADIVGVKSPKETGTPAPSLVAALSALADALSAYCTQLVAWYLDGNAAAKASVRAALKPIDDFRAAAAERKPATPAKEPEADPPATEPPAAATKSAA